MNVEALRRPGANVDWATSGPVLFPNRLQFQEALEQIGYPQTAAQTPKPTYDQYFDFLVSLSKTQRGSAPSEYLGRVMAMNPKMAYLR